MTLETGELAEVAIVGAGPIGLELAAALRMAGVDCVQFEAGQIGQTIFKWPPHTHFFSSPERIAIADVPLHNVDQTKVTGEAYLAYLRSVVQHFGLRVNTYEPVVGIGTEGDGFTLVTEMRSGRKSYRFRRVVLATGGISAPNKLGIRGEDLPHVSHYPGDPHRYFGTRLLVVGGRNSAVETALRAWRAGARVTISYRRDQLSNVTKRHILAEVASLVRIGEIAFLPETVPVEITPCDVALAPFRDGQPRPEEATRFDADFVLLCTGFVADMRLFEMAGAELDGPRRVPRFSTETMETSVPGLFVAGTAAAGTQLHYEVFIENCHEHVVKIIRALTGKTPEQVTSQRWLRADRES